MDSLQKINTWCKARGIQETASKSSFRLSVKHRNALIYRCTVRAGPWTPVTFVAALKPAHTAIVLITVSCLCACVLLRYLVVISRAEEDVVSGRVPLDEAHPAAVTLKLLPRDCEVLQQPMRRDFPHFYLHAHTKRTLFTNLQSTFSIFKMDFSCFSILELSKDARPARMLLYGYLSESPCFICPCAKLCTAARSQARNVWNDYKLFSAGWTARQ